MEKETILIVDDHQDSRVRLWMLMRLEGHEPMAVGSVAEALRALETTPRVHVLRARIVRAVKPA